MAKKKTNEVDYSRPLKNDKYERFCQEYMIDSNGTQAAIRAKYSEKTAGSKAVSLLRIVAIQNRLACLRDKLAQETGISVKMVAEGFRKIATGPLGKTLTNKHKLRAYENLGKHTGFYGKDHEQKQNILTDLVKEIWGNDTKIPINH